MYVDMTGVGGKCHSRVPPVAGPPPSLSGAMLDTTSQPSGARTVSSYAAFMSGWSKHA